MILETESVEYVKYRLVRHSVPEKNVTNYGHFPTPIYKTKSITNKLDGSVLKQFSVVGKFFILGSQTEGSMPADIIEVAVDFCKD